VETLARMLKEPFAPLLPVGAVTGLLLLVWFAVHSWLVVPAQDRAAQLESEWAAARQSLMQRQEAKLTHRELGKFLERLPHSGEFAPLALAISEQAAHFGVKLPALSYRMDRPEAGLATKAFLQGTATGRYEDLRRFIYHLETFQQLLFIEDLSVVRTSSRVGDAVSLNIQIATYLRGGPAPPQAKAGPG